MPDSLRSQRSRIAALSLHSRTDGRAHTAPARKRFLEKFLDEVDPDLILSEAERQRRAAIARRLHFVKLALRSAEARRRRRNGGRP